MKEVYQGEQTSGASHEDDDDDEDEPEARTSHIARLQAFF
jgi:hypothetical protein